VKPHPFNLKRRFIAYKYRKKEYETVIEKADAFLKKKPNNVFVLELRARASASLRDWEQGSYWYQKVFHADPAYLDCSSQLARCAIYTKNWNILNMVATYSDKPLRLVEIEKAFIKKVDSLPIDEFIEMVQYSNIINTLPVRCLERWANLQFNTRPDSILEIDLYCLDNLVGGRYLGHMICKIFTRSISEARNTLEIFARNFPIANVAQWMSPGLEKNPGQMKVISDWIITHINPKKMSLETLEALCVSEYLPPSLESIVREFLVSVPPHDLDAAIRVIGRKTDPRIFITDEILENMIFAGMNPNENSQIHTWMIDHCLRSQKKELINQMLTNNFHGIAKPVINSLQHKSRNRFDQRLVELLELVLEHDYMYEEIRMRQELTKAILDIGHPILALLFAYHCVQIEPQDAVCALYLLQAAIMSGAPDLILQASDITLSLRSRSQKIDYASIAIAAIRKNKINYAKTILIENRLASDTRSQRIRIGIPFHVENNYEKVLDEIENTQIKHLNDLPIQIYHVLALMNLSRYEQSLDIIDRNIRDETEKLLLRHIIYRKSGEVDKAKEVLNILMHNHNRKPLPELFFNSNYDYYSLETGEDSLVDTRSSSQPLVSVIMTVHRWNSAFPLAVHSILAQTHSNLELIVVDDCSVEADVIRYDKLLTDKRIKRIQMDTNSGTYACRNKGLGIAEGDFITFADSDDWNHPDRLKHGITIFEEKDIDVLMGRFIRVNKLGEIQFNGSKISQFCLVGIMIKKSVIERERLQFDSRARFSADSEFFERVEVLLGKERIFRHDSIDIIALHHENSLTGGGPNAIDWMGPRDARLRYVSGYRKSHSKLSLTKEFEFDDFPAPSASLIPTGSREIDKKLMEILGFECINRENTIDLPNRDLDEITVFMATYPGGFKTVGEAIQSLLNQSLPINKLVLHVNGDSSPTKLPNDERLEVILSSSNDADNGKFKYMPSYSGYFFTVDDDINYPSNYVERMIDHIDQYGRKAIIGVHGAVLPVGPPLSRWAEYKESRRTHVFSNQSATFTQVNCLGTGTIAFHSQIGIPNFKEMDTLRMVDLHIAAWAQKNSIPMYSCPRTAKWLTEFEIDQDTRIWAKANTQQDLQWQMIETLNKVQKWNDFYQFPFNLKNGPLSKFQHWKSRQIPIGMKLAKQLDWPDLPDKPKVTIYIPAFNTEKYIIECVQSAINQTYENTEISIQNGGIDDNTLQLLNKHYLDNPKVIISSKPTSLGEGTNIAIGQGTGELILQLDSDDILEPEAVELLVQAIGKKRVCAYGNLFKIDENGKFVDSGWEEAIYTRERLMRSMIVHHPRMFRRDAWEYVGGHDEKLRNAEDYDFFIKLSEVGDFIHIRKDLYSYRILEGSASNFDSDLLTDNTHLVQKRMIKRNGLDYQIVIDNPKFPRNIRFQHIAYSEQD
jgi:glycosyltransferase involved in cell wall biosynthesis